jgi:hypothetical protein
MNWGRISEVGIATRLRPGSSGVQIPAKELYIFFSKTPRPALEPIEPPPQSMVTGGSFLELNRSGRGVNHLPQSNTEVKNKWI